MQRSMWLRRTALIAMMAVIATACGNGDDDPGATDTGTPPATDTQSPTDMGESPEATGSPSPTEQATATGKGDGTLTIGSVLPQSGQLAFLGAPQINGVQLAIDEINAAGGFQGSDVVYEEGDSGTDPTVARQTVNRLLGTGADAIVGAAASGVSQEIIQTLFDNQIVQCSASNTSPNFSTQANAGYYFRTVPPDEAVTPVIVNAVVTDGFTDVAIVNRADDYGQALADLLNAGFADQNINIVADVSYDPNTTTFDAEVEQITSANAQAVVIVGFNEAATLIRQLIEAGQSPDSLYGADGLFAPDLPEQVGGGDDFIDGMKVIGASGGTDFNQEVLNPALPDNEKGNFIYGAQAYDCAIVIALAANAAASDDPSVFAEEAVNVTTGGTECTSYEECLGMLENDEDIDYNGPSGPIELLAGGGAEGEDVNLGDPAVGRYAIAEYQNGGELVQVSEQDVNVQDLG